MILLATSLAWFLAAALALGLLIGWLSFDDEGLGLRRRQLWPLALVLLLVIALRLGLIGGQAALWVESALLFLAAYLLGALAGTACGAGGLWLRRRRGRMADKPPAPPAPPLLLPPPSPQSPVPTAEPAETQGPIVVEPEAKPSRRRKPADAGAGEAPRPARRRRKPAEE